MELEALDVFTNKIIKTKAITLEHLTNHQNLSVIYPGYTHLSVPFLAIQTEIGSKVTHYAISNQATTPYIGPEMSI